MRFIVDKAGGKFHIEAPDLKGIIKQASLIQSIPDQCSICGGQVAFSYRTPKGYEYFSLVCQKCGARRNFGQNKDDKNLFLRFGEGFAVYEGKDNTHTDAPPEEEAYEE